MFFGGAAGGGKSDALLMAALQYVDVPHYNAILFRRTYADLTLPGALLDRARDWLEQTDAKWDDREHTWRFPRTRDCDLHGASCPSEWGGSLTFGYLQTDRTKFRYQSADFQFIGFDELTQFSQSMYLYLFTRLRKEAGLRVPLRMRSASNPGGFGHDWVKQRFLVSAKEYGAVFVPSKLQDNPSLDYDAYVRSLERLDPVTRERMLRGDWDVRDEGMFRRQWFKVIDAQPSFQRPPRKVRYWDLAATEETTSNNPDATCGTLLARDENRRFYVLDVRYAKAGAHDVESLVRATAIEDGKDVPVRIEQEPGAAGKSLISYYTRHVLPGWDVRGVPSSRDKVTRAAPWASQAEAGNVTVVRGPWLGRWLDEHEAFPNVEHDDQVDSASGGMAQLLTAAVGQSSSYRDPVATVPVIRRGDLVLRGAKYVDKP